MFILVNFVEENSVAVVPVSWFASDGCWWPKCIDVIKVVKTGRPHTAFPNLSWQLYQATRYRPSQFTIFGTYEEARTRLPNDNDPSDSDGIDPRKRKTNNRDLSDSDSEPPTPPPKKRIASVIPPIPSFSQTNLELPNEIEPEDEVLPHSNIFNQGDLNSIEGLDFDADAFVEDNQGIESEVAVIDGNNFSVNIGSNLLTEILNTQQQILRRQIQMRVIADQRHKYIENKLGSILTAVQSFTGTVAKDRLLSKPLADVTEFENFERELISSPNVKSQLVSELQIFGGLGCHESVKQMLFYLMTDLLTLSFSLTGQKGNIKFDQTQMYIAMKEAVLNRTWNPPVTVDTLNSAIMSHFKHAPIRIGKELNLQGKPSKTTVLNATKHRDPPVPQ